jgi:hypothetical protein
MGFGVENIYIYIYIYKQYYRVFPKASSLARAKKVSSRIWKETTAADHGQASVQEIDGPN